MITTTIAIVCGSVLGAGFLAMVALAIWQAVRDRRNGEGPDRRYRGRHERPHTRRKREAHARASKARAAVIEARRRAMLRHTVAEVVGENTIEFRAIVRNFYDTGEIDRVRDLWAGVAL